MVNPKIILVSILAGGAVAVPQWPWWPGRATTTAAAPVPAATTTYDPPFGATQSLYGRCGGDGYTGAIACPTGAYCKLSNQWYSQCVALEGANPAPGPPGEVRTLTTIFSVPGTVISTRITYLVPKPTTTSAVSVVTLTLTPDDPCDHPLYC